jgi:hypothetical protein
VAGWVLAVAGQHEAVLVVRLGVGGHIQQLQRLGSVERGQTGQRAGAGQELDRLADVAGWVLAAGAGWVARGGAGDRQAARGGAGGHIQQLQRLGSVERGQTGQRADAGQELDQYAPTWPAGRWRWPGSTRRCWWKCWAA